MLVKLGSLKNSTLIILVKSVLGFSSCGGIVLLLVIWRVPPVGMPATLEEMTLQYMQSTFFQDGI